MDEHVVKSDDFDERRGYHDIGGARRHYQRVSTKTAVPPGWATLTDALRTALGDRYRLHEQRRKIEELGEEVYDSVTYYEIRVLALLKIGVERGFLSQSEVEVRMNEIRKRGN
ncbi:MAG: hypothetical protein CMM16_04785 [Rhodospirillaceae bacterium]|nr:hypothetical protein [Rhodospirillaceae bacterium]